MDKIKLYEDLKILSDNVYDTQTKPLPNGWRIMTTRPNSGTGFKGAVYHHNESNITAVVFAGTDAPSNFLNKSQREECFKDVANDKLMYKGEVPIQFPEALDLYKWAALHLPKSHMVLSGHSLGGSLVQLVSAKTGVKGVTFNAYGTGQILENEGFKDWKHINVDNIGNLTDFVYKQNFHKQAGETYVLDDGLNKKEIRDVILNEQNITFFKAKHPTDTMPPLQNSVPIAHVEKLPRLSLINKLEVKENLDNASVKEYKKHIKELHKKIEQAERERIIQEFERKTNNFINDMRSFCSQSGKNIKMTIQTAAGRIEHIQSGYIPPQAKIMSQQQFQLKGTTQDIIRQIKNHIK